MYSEPEIHELIAERLQCKMSRDFNTADAIQADLIAAGVYVHDGLKEWRADG
jgi:cysteinyl-tRNA synthetase